jgi:hypothetical protein
MSTLELLLNLDKVERVTAVHRNRASLRFRSLPQAESTRKMVELNGVMPQTIDPLATRTKAL